MKATKAEDIVAAELRKNIGFRLLVTLAYSAKDYEKALPEVADVFAEVAVKALIDAGRLASQSKRAR